MGDFKPTKVIYKASLKSKTHINHLYSRPSASNKKITYLYYGLAAFSLGNEYWRESESIHKITIKYT